MKFIADLHIHSHYSRATSRELVPERLEYWARIKGITVVGTGDFTHPGWDAELKEKLEPAEFGLYKLKPELRRATELAAPFLPKQEVRFMLTAEISNIYKKNDRVRKVHNVIFVPDFETAARIRQKLLAIKANITSDGRPILGLDSRDLLEMALEANEDIFFVPAHIWTPWFSALGSKSGFDSIADCYGDLANHIHAVETGLSTDPPMNWMCSFLDSYTLMANSDAHSPERLGRNANRFDTELSYDAIVDALKSGDPAQYKGTIDLFPQEGKYHYDGHRKCGICWNPVETLKHGGICSGCGKPVTIGVMNRVVQLSDREHPEERPNRHDFRSIIPLKEMLGELEGVGPNSKKVDRRYMELIRQGITELELLLEASLEEVESLAGHELGEAVRRMRSRQIHIQEGYDGEYGVINVFAPGESPALDSRNSLFKDFVEENRPVPQRREMINFDLEEFQRLRMEKNNKTTGHETKPEQSPGWGLNPAQQAAVDHFYGPVLVIAGPGTGKTRVLTYRILNLIKNREIPPENILAVTFTNKAAAEISQRLTDLLEESSVTVTTFHALGYDILSEQKGNTFSILDPEDRKRIIQKLTGLSPGKTAVIAKGIESAKQLLKSPKDIAAQDPQLAENYEKYQEYLNRRNLYDLDDLICEPVKLLSGDRDIRESYQAKFKWILIDEYQDINYGQYNLIQAITHETTDSEKFFGDPGGIPQRFSKKSTGRRKQNKMNICVIGDPDQAIYGFRGADVAFIRKFQEDYPGAAVYRLQQSYRCTDSILEASGNIMERPKNSPAVLSGMGEGIKIKIVKNATHRSEAEYVARTIEQMMGGLRFFSIDSSITEGNKEAEIGSLSDFVVLCRVKSQIEALEKAFMDHSIPYQVVGEEPFFKQEPLGSIIDLLKLSRNPGHEILQERLLEKGIIESTDIDRIHTIYSDAVRTGTVKEIIQIVINSYFSHLKEEENNRFRQLLELAGEFDADIDRFIRFTALGSAVDTYRPNLENVTLMTLHAAKGLEFKAVFIVGCEEGLFPYSLFKEQEADREEERRLLYVGMTRAKQFLFLCHAEKRFLMGREYRLARSPFLDRIEKKLIELSQQELKTKNNLESVQRKLFDL